MQKSIVIVAGHQFAEPCMWGIYLAKRFNHHATQEILQEPDRCLLVEIQTEHHTILTKAPIHALFHEKESYRVLLTQPADAVIYFQSICAELVHLSKRDFNIVRPLLAARPDCPPVFTLLNDIYCGSPHVTTLPETELNKYIIPGSRVFRTAISYLPAVGEYSTGADEVFDELVKVLNEKMTLTP